MCYIFVLGYKLFLTVLNCMYNFTPHYYITQSTYQFRQLYGRRLYILAVLHGKLYTVDLTAPLAFEAVWTLAKALRMTSGTCLDTPKLDCMMDVGL